MSQATFDDERAQLKGQLLDLRSELDKARSSKRELEKKWAGFDADAWQQQQQQQKEMEIMLREKEQEWQEERQHLKVEKTDCEFVLRMTCDRIIRPLLLMHCSECSGLWTTKRR